MLKHRANNQLTLEQYISNDNFALNLPKYTDQRGNVIVDETLKYEDINNELAITFKSLGIPYNGNLGVNAKSEYRKDRRGYHEVLNDQQAHIISDKFSKEIELHNYQY